MAATNNIRRGPEDSATNHAVGTILKGNDKNMWIVATDKNGRPRWTPLKKSDPIKTKQAPQTFRTKSKIKSKSTKASAIKKNSSKKAQKKSPMTKSPVIKSSKTKIPDEHLEDKMVVKMAVIVWHPNKAIPVGKVGATCEAFYLPESKEDLIASKYKDKLIEVPLNKWPQIYISKNKGSKWFWIPFKMPEKCASAEAYYSQFGINKGPWNVTPTLLKLKSIKPKLKTNNIYYGMAGWHDIYAYETDIYLAIESNVSKDKTFQKNFPKAIDRVNASFFGVSDFDYFCATRTCYLQLRTEIKPDDLKAFLSIMSETFGEKFIVKSGKIPKYYIEIWDRK
jgi:hypothetical protein